MKVVNLEYYGIWVFFLFFELLIQLIFIQLEKGMYGFCGFQYSYKVLIKGKDIDEID